MQVLNLIIVVLGLVVASSAFSTYFQFKDEGLSRREITVITILLLCGLNIVKGSLEVALGEPPHTTGQKLLEYLCVGAALFQLLLSVFVLKHINKKQ